MLLSISDCCQYYRSVFALAVKQLTTATTTYSESNRLALVEGLLGLVRQVTVFTALERLGVVAFVPVFVLVLCARSLACSRNGGPGRPAQ